MKVGVVGLGYVGLPLVVAFAEAGEEVIAVDLDAKKVADVLAGESYIEDIPSERLQAVLHRIDATTPGAAGLGRPRRDRHRASERRPRPSRG